MPLRHGLTLAVMLTVTMIAAAPAPDRPSLDSVTEHFAAARPGTVPRIPARLFLQVDSPGSDEETHFCHKSPSVSPSYNLPLLVQRQPCN